MLSEFLNKVSNCNNCDLRNNRCNPIVYRGNLKSKIMIVGEAIGKCEEEQNTPFVGPAGQLLDKIFASVGFDTNDLLITNSLMCRPIAPEGSGKQNLTPTWEQQLACRSNLEEFINIIDPKIIIACGRVALSSLFRDEKVKLGQFEGEWTYYMRDSGKDINMFVICHPSALLYLSKFPDKEKEAKQKVWEYMQLFRDSYKSMLE